MSKKSQKVLASASIMSLVLSTVAMAAPTAGTAVSGSNRVDTSVAIAKQVYSKWTDSKVAVIANGADAHLVDALTVAPLAAQKQAPIFLTLGTSTLEDSIVNELKSQGVTSVYVVGGTVTTAVDAQLKAAGVATVTHLAGATRFETAQAINNELEKAGAPSGYAVVNTNSSVADALSIAAEAAKNNIEIVLASDANSVPVDLTGKKVYAVGGTGVLSDALVTKLNATRLAGANRFATNAAVLQGLDANLDYTTTYVADGTDAHLVDSLPGSVLAAQTGSPIVLVSDTVDPSVVSVLTGKTDKMTTVTPLGGAVNTNAVAGVVDPTSVGTTTPTGALAVASVTATAADTITVKFNQTPADTSKVVFDVERGNTPFAVTTAWNGSEVTLKYSSNFPMGDYTVNVKNDTTDLGTSNLTIDQEKVAKIDVTTDKFATLSDGKTGYFTYRVLDQYGVDITNTKSTSIQWTIPGADSYSDSQGEKGVIKATVNSGNQFNFLNLGTISVTGVDNSDNIVVTKSLSVGAAAGTLSDFKLLDVTNVDNLPLQAGDTSTVWDITYSAKDMGGNDTDNFTLLQGGLIDQNTTTDASEILLSTSGYISATVKEEDGKGVIELKCTTEDALTTDLPVTVTAITKNGTTSTLNLTLKKKAQVAKFNIFAPTEDIAYGDSKEVPYEAVDQDGNAITKFDDLVDTTASNPYAAQNKYTASKYGNVNLSPIYNGTEGFYWVKRGDDTAKLMYQAPEDTSTNHNANDITKTLTASTNTGSFSTITINIRKIALANSLTSDDTQYVTKLTKGGYEDLDTDAIFTAKDQYGRAVTLDGDTYIKAQVIGGGTSVSIVGNDTAASTDGTTTGDISNDIYIMGATTSGTTTIKFSLMNTSVADPIATKTIDFTTVKLSDISGITLATPATQYDIYDVSSSTTKAASDLTNAQYYNSFTVYGTDSNGNKVILPRGTAFDLSASNNDLYGLQNRVAPNYTDASHFDQIQFGAWSDNDTASTVVSVSTPITDENGNMNVKSTSVTVAQSEATPIAQSITSDDEIDPSKHASGDMITDCINVADQYGENMLSRYDGVVKIYVNGVLQANNWAANKSIHDADLRGKTIAVVANNGKSLTVTVKD